jgi:RecA/RadA recombinase
MPQRRRREVTGVAEQSGTPTKKKAVPTKKVVNKKSPAKKKTTKKKSKAAIRRELHAPGQLAHTTSGYLAEVLEDIRAETGDLTVCTMKDAGRLIVGMPWPSLSLEYLTYNTVCPFEKFVQIYGPPGLGKSGLTFEFMRMANRLGGIGNYLEHETKFNGDWAASTIGWDKAQCLGATQCDSPEAWQAMLMLCIQKIQNIMEPKTKERIGSGRVWPWVGIVDSLMAKLTKENQDKIATDGFAGRGFPVEALSITRYLQGMAHRLRGWPFLVITVNHEKLKKDDQGKPNNTRAGGKHIDFQGSFQFALRQAGKVDYSDYKGNRLSVKVDKNSYGPGDRKIIVECIWFDELLDLQTMRAATEESEEVEMRQITRWDWHGATTRLILDHPDATLGTEMRKLTGLRKKSQKFAWSTLLGVPKTQPCGYHKLGARLMANREMVEELRDMLQIRRRKVFVPGVEYTKQILSAKQLAYEGG